MIRSRRGWETYWYGPVAAVRPHLFLEALLVLLALDLWVLRLERAGSYGAHDFNVAHFGWLDVLQPTPTPEIYAGVLLLSGLLALTLALAGACRPGLAALTVLYTYSWAMSMRDLFQHHYLLSIVLLCTVLFPRVGGADLEQSEPRTSAVGYALLRTTTAVVYAFAAVAKLDGEWLRGATLAYIGESQAAFTAAAGYVARLGFGAQAFWVLLATGAIVVEVVIALAYLLAARRDTTASRLGRLAFPAAALLTIGLHLGFEALGFRIGWFTAYMILLAGVVFLPEPVLLSVTTAVRWPARLLSKAPRPSTGPSILLLAVVSGSAVVVIGSLLDVPGAVWACAIAALALGAASVRAVRRHAFRAAVRTIAATALAALVMWGTIAATPVRYAIHSDRFDDLRARGRTEAALAAYDATARHAPRGDAHAQARLAHMLRLLGRSREAVRHYRHALALDPDHVPANNNLAWMLAAHPDPAIRDTGEAVRLAEHARELTAGRDAAILDTLAGAYAADGRRAQATATARRAVAIATQAGAAKLAAVIGERLRRYERGQAWVTEPVVPAD